MDNTIRVCASCGFILVDFNTASDVCPPMGYTDLSHGECNSCIIKTLMEDGATKEQANNFVAHMESKGGK